MAAPYARQQSETVPLKMVGGNKFGRYSKISVEETYNFIVSDDALVAYAGYKNVTPLAPENIGRGLYTSSTKAFMLAVIGAQVYIIDNALVPTFVGQLATSTGDVYISENNARQIAITDGQYIYVYDYSSPTPIYYSSIPGGGITFPYPDLANPNAGPGYISFQNGRFIVAINNTQVLLLSNFNDAISPSAWTIQNRIGTIQIKPCTIQAVVPMPGGGNNLLVIGSNAAQVWQDVGLARFPYQLNTSSNIDYGCINPASVASLESFVVWLAVNEQAGISVMYTNGQQIKRISTDGIDYKLANLKNPEDCIGFLFRQDGHLIYQFTFQSDNLTYAYDFNTGLFFTITDEDLNYHIARQVVLFNNKYYFVSLKGGNIYEFGTQYTNADYGYGNIYPIPRIRVTPPLRLPTQAYYIINTISFAVENGQKNTIIDNPLPIASENIELSVSVDGGESFGTSTEQNMNPTGKRMSRMIFYNLGIANDCTFQFRFNGSGRFVVFDGLAEIYK